MKFTSLNQWTRENLRYKPIHLGLLFLFDQTPVLLPLHVFTDGPPLTSNPNGQVIVQLKPWAIFCSLQSVGSYSPNGIFGNAGQRISETDLLKFEIPKFLIVCQCDFYLRLHVVCNPSHLDRGRQFLIADPTK